MEKDEYKKITPIEIENKKSIHEYLSRFDIMTKKIAVLSANNHPGYLFFIPIVEWIWNKFGWEIALFVTSDVAETYHRSPTTQVDVIPDIEGVRTGTLAQVVRHFASNVLPKEAYIMVQDIDLIPLKDWWKPDLTRPSISGYPEMTGGAFIPVHYTGMLGRQWYDLMGCTGNLAADMEREMKANGRAYGQTWGDENGEKGYWDADWDILTTKVRLRPPSDFIWVPRPMVNGLPYGRVDRSTIVVGTDGSYSWGQSGEITEKWDCHAEWHNSSSPEKWKNIRSLLLEHFPDAPITGWDIHAKNHYERYGLY